MTRRKLFGISWPLCLGGWAFAQEREKVKEHPKAPRGDLYQAPTMEQLINLAWPKENVFDWHYGRILDLALKEILIVAVSGDHEITYYKLAGFLPRLSNVQHGATMRFKARNAATTLVPRHLLPHFKPENRGEGFPAGVPYRPL